MLKIIAGILVVFGMAASTVDAQPTAGNELAQVGVDWARDWEAKELGSVLSLYTDDAVFMDANGSRVTGKAALQKFFATVLRQYSAHPSLRSVKNGSSGDLGYDWGDYTETVVPVADPAHAIRTAGTYLVILQNVSGHWLIAEQMWTGSVPVPVKK
jgi:ketosteroid isomerase-like protein